VPVLVMLRRAHSNLLRLRPVAARLLSLIGWRATRHPPRKDLNSPGEVGFTLSVHKSRVRSDGELRIRPFAFLAMRGSWEGGQRQALQDASQRLQISLTPMLLEESTPSEYQRVFTEIARERSDAIIVHARGELFRHRQLIVELAEKSRLPAIYPYREYVEGGGLMAYAVDFGEFGRRMADDVHEILNGAKPGDIPIYLPTKYEFLINLKAANCTDD
jgi:ABC transporter substrate binding protein